MLSLSTAFIQLASVLIWSLRMTNTDKGPAPTEIKATFHLARSVCVYTTVTLVIIYTLYEHTDRFGSNALNLQHRHCMQ